MREVTLEEVLEAREIRAKVQRRLLEQHTRPVLSFTMNIPGPIKDSPLIRRGFDAGLSELKYALKEAGAAILSPEEKRAVTGCEFLCAVEGNAEDVKTLCLRIEDASPMGRLFDMDVIAPDGRKLERAEERRCLVCGKAGRGCASRRLHSLDELSAAVNKLLREGLLAADVERVENLVTHALIEEVNTTPKPGLVDRNNNGSHTDMTVETFLRSAAALRDYWGDCFRIGVQDKDKSPEDCFAHLRARGLEAEKAMLTATGGVNTHKGAIFLLGTICGAVGRLWQPESPCREPEGITKESAFLCAKAVSADFSELEKRGHAVTAGERLYLKTGRKGVRGELAEGLPGVTKCVLPALRKELTAGASRNDAGVIALLHLIARGTDSNMVKRGGPEAAHQAAEAAAALLPRPAREAVEALDERFIAQNLSPGGCADLLAVSFFLLDWETTEV